MKFPFVSRSTMDALIGLRDERIEELKTQLADSQKEIKVLHNQMAWRMSGVALDPDLLPEQYRPKSAAPPEQKNSAGKPTIVPGGPKAVRAMIREQETKREEEFMESQGRSVPRHEVPPAQMEITKKLADTVKQAESENKGA